MEWTPIIAAVAGFIALQGPAVANLLFTIANRRKLAEVHQSTNGNLQAVREQSAALVVLVQHQHAELEALRGQLDRLRDGPAGPV